MSKKKRNQPPQEQPEPVFTPPPAVHQAEQEKDVSKAQLWTFWIGVAAAVIAARVLNYAMPGVSESVIERWIMLAFAAFLVGFLIKLK